MVLGEWGFGDDRRLRTLLWGLVAADWACRGLWPMSIILVTALMWLWMPLKADRTLERWEICRFWQQVALLASAGLTVLASVEEAAPLTPLGQDIKQLIGSFAHSPNDGLDTFLEHHRSPEAQYLAHLLVSAWHHGLDVEVAHEQALGMIERLGQEARLKEANRSLWASLLPALLLFNVLVLFLVPLTINLTSSWGSL